MTQQDTIKNRERFQVALQNAASKQAIPLERLSWRDIPNRDASDLIVEAGGKKRVFTITDNDMINDIEGQIDQILNVAIDVD
ncbi:MAG TPA: hypothetical protein VFY96_04735 [Candidatus Binatia bacterium]|nr:hypothetical protein [Candidatus Binatia bacterium]